MKTLLLSTLLLAPAITFAQSVGIGTTTPAASAALEISSTTKGLLLPRVSTTQMNDITGALPGLLVFNTTESKFYGCTAAADAAAVQQNNYNMGYNSAGPIGQSFTVPQNGLLTSISAYSSTSGSRTYTLRVYTGQGFSGPLLGTSAPQTVTGVFVPITFSLAALNIQLVAGQDYTFSLTSSVGTVNMLYQSGGSSYGGGQLYYAATTDAAADLRFQLTCNAAATWVPLN